MSGTSMEELDAQLSALLSEDVVVVPSVVANARVAALEARVEALERALQDALTGFETLARERITSAAQDAAECVLAMLESASGPEAEPEAEAEA
jgi:hypothetical protein